MVEKPEELKLGKTEGEPAINSENLPSGQPTSSQEEGRVQAERLVIMEKASAEKDARELNEARASMRDPQRLLEIEAVARKEARKIEKDFPLLARLLEDAIVSEKIAIKRGDPSIKERIVAYEAKQAAEIEAKKIQDDKDKEEARRSNKGRTFLGKLFFGWTKAEDIRDSRERLMGHFKNVYPTQYEAQQIMQESLEREGAARQYSKDVMRQKAMDAVNAGRSEERRVGKECRL